jgi:hypothetical protein
VSQAAIGDLPALAALFASRRPCELPSRCHLSLKLRIIFRSARCLRRFTTLPPSVLRKNSRYIS